MGHWVKACSLEELEGEGRCSLELGEGKKIMVVKLGEEIKALEAICTHEYADLTMGFFDEESVTCPLHLSRFDLRSGEALNPPAERPLKLFPVKVEGTSVFIEVED